MKKTNTNELSLAELISLVLNHPELPDPIYEALDNAINEVFNSDVHDQNEITTSAPYIDMIIRSYHKKQSCLEVSAAENVVAMRVVR